MHLLLIAVLMLVAFAGGYVLAVFKGPTIDAEMGKIEHKGVTYIAEWRKYRTRRWEPAVARPARPTRISNRVLDRQESRGYKESL